MEVIQLQKKVKISCTFWHLSKRADVLKWANQKVINSGGTATAQKLSDIMPKDNRFLFQLLHAIDPRSVSEADILSAEVPDSMIRNALLLLCASRRFGCTLFLLPSDIALCRPDAVFLLIGTLMASTR